MFVRKTPPPCWNEEAGLLCSLNMGDVQRELCHWRWPLVLVQQPLRALRLQCPFPSWDLCSCQLGIWKLFESRPSLKIRNPFWVVLFTWHLESIRALRLGAGRPFNSQRRGSLSLENFQRWSHLITQSGKFHSVEANKEHYDYFSLIPDGSKVYMVPTCLTLSPVTFDPAVPCQLNLTEEWRFQRY